MIWKVRTVAAILVVTGAGCALDPAEREYMEALRGEETGMSRQMQIAHIDGAIALAPGEHLVQMESHVGTSFYVRGKARAALGRHKEAIADFTEAIRLHPELVYPRIARSESYTRVGDSRRAVEDRAAADRAIRDNWFCTPCTDPFRY